MWRMVVTNRKTGRVVHESTLSGGAGRAANRALAWMVFGYHVTLSREVSA
jgi:hypothetical protein